MNRNISNEIMNKHKIIHGKSKIKSLVNSVIFDIISYGYVHSTIYHNTRVEYKSLDDHVNYCINHIYSTFYDDKYIHLFESFARMNIYKKIKSFVD